MSIKILIRARAPISCLKAMRLTVEEIAEAVGGKVLRHSGAGYAPMADKSEDCRRALAECMPLNECAARLSVKRHTLSPEGADVVISVSADSRAIQPGSLFIALRGDNFDGHDHVRDAFEKGAVCALAEKVPAGLIPAAHGLIIVPSTHRALLDLAAYCRRRLGTKIVAVTGSVGKTTTKDMIASVLSRRYVTLKTPGNKNNLIGMPLTLLSLDEHHEAAVLEMGMNRFGEIRDLSMTATPDVCVITNIGDAHMEYLGSREGILKAKLEIMDGLKPGGIVILNGGDPLLAGLRGKFPDAVFCTADSEAFGLPGASNGGKPSAEIHKDSGAQPSGGIKRETEIRAAEIRSRGFAGIGFRLYIGNESREVFVPSPGTHMVMNALLAAAVGNCFGLTLSEIAEGISAFTPTDRRMTVHEARGMKIIDDAYNASPASIRAAVQVLAGMKEASRRVCILGDMLELGEHSERLHRETGEYIAEAGIDLIIAVGDNARYYITAVKRGNESRTRWFKDNRSFLTHWEEILRPGDAVLVKASFGMNFKEIIQGVLA